jgi:hypothetical protein
MALKGASVPLKRADDTRCTAPQRRETASARYMLVGSQILELARGAKSLFLRQDPAEQRRLLKTLLSNCTLQGSTLCPTYRKPFDVLAKANETGNWLGVRDGFWNWLVTAA